MRNYPELFDRSATRLDPSHLRIFTVKEFRAIGLFPPHSSTKKDDQDAPANYLIDLQDAV